MQRYWITADDDGIEQGGGRRHTWRISVEIVMIVMSDRS